MHNNRLSRRELFGSAAVAVLTVSTAASDAAELLPVPAAGKSMYVSIRDDILMHANYATVAEGVRAIGVSAVEVAVGRDFSVRPIEPAEGKPRLFLNSNDDVAALKSQLDSTGVRISSFLVHNNFAATDIEAELAWVVRVVEAASQLGASAIRIDSAMPGGTEKPVQERQELFARCVKKILDSTKNSRVDLGIENHGVEGNDPEFLLGLISMVGSKRLGVTMDMGNFYWAGYTTDMLYDVLQRLAPHTKHTHIKNINYPADIRNTRRAAGFAYDKYVCPIPDGDIDIKRVVGFLKAAGYRRDLCIEDESLSKYDDNRKKANLLAAAKFLKNLV